MHRNALAVTSSQLTHLHEYGICTAQGDVLVVRALRDLLPGAELLHCYGPQAGEHITPLRRRLLQQQYRFHCM